MQVRTANKFPPTMKTRKRGGRIQAKLDAGMFIEELCRQISIAIHMQIEAAIIVVRFPEQIQAAIIVIRFPEQYTRKFKQ